MTSGMFAILAIICFALAVGFFFWRTTGFIVNSAIKKYWIQAEKCYLNFELMFMDDTFSLARCKILVLTSTFLGLVLAAWLAWEAPLKIFFFVSMAVGGFSGYLLPGTVTSFMHRRYVDNFEGQLLDAITMLGSSLRSGLSLLQAMELVANEMSKPISQEFRLLLNEYNYGMTLDEVMARMMQRVPSQDLGIVLESILILRSTGANLVEVFSVILHTIRERKRVEEKVKTMTSMGLFQAIILISLPFVLMVVLDRMNPGYLDPLFEAKIGWMMLFVMVIMLIVGGVLIKNIVTIDV